MRAVRTSPTVVLVADCSPAVTSAASAELRDAFDCFVATANDLGAAAWWLGLVRPTAVVACWSLAGGGLPALLRVLDASPSADPMPVVALGRRRDVPAAGSAGCAAFVPKPLRAGALASALRRVLGPVGR